MAIKPYSERRAKMAGGNFTRRGFLAGSIGGMAALAGAAPLVISRPGRAAQSLTVVEWGGAYGENMQKLASTLPGFDINWVFHTGGAAAILPKIRATWPDAKYDLISGWDPVFKAVLREGWAQPVTADKVPNLADIPEGLLYKDGDGNVANVPRTLSAFYWFYREDTCPVQIKSLDDLLDPKLKGKVLFPDPTWGSNFQTITLALHRGGDERNMDPGWSFLKELAASGNIGRVSSAEVDVINSVTSGETCVGFTSVANALKIAENFPVKHLTKVGRDSGFVTGLYQEGWYVLKGPNADAALELVNQLISPENNQAFNAAIGGIPTNTKAKPADNLAHVTFASQQEIADFTYIPDWEFISEQADAWKRRWEEEIAPLL
jgi:putative spermidine/putrescine transport system substrate-binding protein